MSYKSDIDMTLERVNRGVPDAVGELTVRSMAGGNYRLTQDLTDGGERSIGPMGTSAGEFDMFLRGVAYGLDISRGVYDDE